MITVANDMMIVFQFAIISCVAVSRLFLDDRL